MSVARISSVLLLALAPLSVGCASSAPSASVPPRGAVVAHRTSIAWLPPQVRRYAPLIDQASRRHGVDANLIAIVMIIESHGRADARSPAGALGLMQIMPKTGADIAKRRRIARFQTNDLLDPAVNIDFGTWYLAQQVRSFWSRNPDVTVDRVAAAYNGGPGRLRAHLRSGRALSSETERYRALVTAMWRERHAAQSVTYRRLAERG